MPAVALGFTAHRPEEEAPEVLCHACEGAPYWGQVHPSGGVNLEAFRARGTIERYGAWRSCAGPELLARLDRPVPSRCPQ